MLIRSLIAWIILNTVAFSEEHWATGGWNSRHWGAIRLYEEPIKFATDIDPDGFLQDYGLWQDYDDWTVIIIWTESGRREMIAKDGNKFYSQISYSFGISSNAEEIKKTIIGDKDE